MVIHVFHLPVVRIHNVVISMDSQLARVCQTTLENLQIADLNVLSTRNVPEISLVKMNNASILVQDLVALTLSATSLNTILFVLVILDLPEIRSLNVHLLWKVSKVYNEIKFKLKSK